MGLLKKNDAAKNDAAKNDATATERTDRVAAWEKKFSDDHILAVATTITAEHADRTGKGR